MNSEELDKFKNSPSFIRHLSEVKIYSNEIYMNQMKNYYRSTLNSFHDNHSYSPNSKIFYSKASGNQNSDFKQNKKKYLHLNRNQLFKLIQKDQYLRNSQNKINFIHLRTKDFNETKISLPNIEKPITFNLDSTIRRPNLYKSSSLVNLPYNSRKKFPLFEDTKDKQVAILRYT